MIHELKCEPEYFREIVNDNKLFEVRKNDRDYRVGDLLALNECEHDENADCDCYTGNSLLCMVTYMLNDERFCKDGYVIMGIEKCTVNFKGCGPVSVMNTVERIKGGLGELPYYRGDNEN